MKIKTQEQELAALEAKVIKDREDVLAKYRILELLGSGVAGYASPFIHRFKLYNVPGSLHFSIQKYASIAEGKSPDRELLSYLLEKFPPLPLVMVDDGCKSFRSASGQWPGKVLEVCPMTVRLEVFQGPDAHFEWLGEVGGEVNKFQVEFPLWSTDLGSLELRYNHYGRGEEIASVERCEFTPKHGAQRIRWASGDRKTPNSFTLWWDVDSGKAVDWPGLIKETKHEAA